MEPREEIKSLRAKIDAIDLQILGLLHDRARIAKEIGESKSGCKMNPYDPQREEEVLRQVGERSGPFPRRGAASVFREIISGCRSLEAELTITYLGPPATYSHEACMEKFGSSVRSVPRGSISEIFESVEREKAHFGMVPIENSTEGAVNRTLDRFLECDVQICGEVSMPVSHHLLSQTGTATDVERIYSHPQAFGQCREWLARNFPGIPQIETLSTAQAAQMALGDERAAAVAGLMAARMYGLRLIESRIEDSVHNFTRFLVLGRDLPPRTGRDKTSLLFSIADLPGSLSEALKPFSERGLNLTKIESRPIKDQPWQYVFFLDFEGHTTDAIVQEAIHQLRKGVLFLKILGSYPRTV